MKLNRLDRGEMVAAIAAIVLFVSMFLDWYGSEIKDESFTEINLFFMPGGNAWQTLDLIPVILVVTVAVTIVFTQMALSGSGWEPTIRPSAAVTVLGGVSFLLILLRIVVPPDFEEVVGYDFHTTLKPGIFVALVAAAGVAVGGFRAMGRRGASFAKIADELGVKSRPAAAKRRIAVKPERRSEKRPEPRG
jgi:hypothetical protein